MPRSLDSAVIAELQNDNFNFCHLVFIDFDTQLRITDNFRDVVYGGNTFVASSHLLDVGSPTEQSQLAVGSINLTLSGVEQSYISAFLQSNWINKRVTIQRALLDDNNNIIGTPIPVFDGQITQFSIDESDNESSIDIAIASHWANFELKAGRFTNNNSQQYHFAGDLGFEYAANSVKDLRWGRE